MFKKIPSFILEDSLKAAKSRKTFILSSHPQQNRSLCFPFFLEVWKKIVVPFEKMPACKGDWTSLINEVNDSNLRAHCFLLFVYQSMILKGHRNCFCFSSHGSLGNYLQLTTMITALCIKISIFGDCQDHLREVGQNFILLFTNWPIGIQE